MAVNGKPAVAPGAAAPKSVASAFESFVRDEKKRLEPKKAAAASKAREDKLAELRSFSQSFKVRALPHPVPSRAGGRSSHPYLFLAQLPYAERLGHHA